MKKENMNRNFLLAVMTAILSLVMTTNAQIIFSDDFEEDPVAGPAANPLLAGWLTDSDLTGNADGILQDNEHRIWIAPGSAGSSGIDSKGWICSAPGSFIYKDLGLAVANTNYLIILFIDSESSETNYSINYQVELLKGNAYGTALPVASISGNEPGGEDGKYPGEYKRLEYTTGAVAGTDHLFLQVKLISSSSWMFLDDVAVSIVEDFGTSAPWVFGFEASPERVYPGAASTLTWATSLSEDALVIEPGSLDVLGETSTIVNPTSNTVYTIVASNADGSVTNTAEVAIITNKPIIQAFASSDYLVNIGEPFILNWDVDDTVSLSINGMDYSTTNATEKSVFTDTLFTLIATNPNGTSTGTVEVLVLAEPPVINDFSINYPFVYMTGTVVTLSWEVDNEQELYLDGTDVTGLLSADATVHSNTTYTLIARNLYGDTTNTVDVSVADMTLLWRRDWKQVPSNTAITDSNLDGGPIGDVEVGSQDFTVVSGPIRVWSGTPVGGYELIHLNDSSSTWEAAIEIADTQYADDETLILDFVIGTGASAGLTGDWFVEFGTISGGTFTALPEVDAGAVSYQLAATLTTSENFMDDTNDSAFFGYNVGGRLQQLTVDATSAVNGQNIAFRFGVTASASWCGFSDMALSRVANDLSPDEIGTIAINKIAAGEVIISWGPTTTGQTYNVETNTHLEGPNWGVFESIIGTGGGITVTSSAAEAQLFYKVTSE